MSVDTEEEKAHWVRCFGAYSVLSEAEIAKVSQAVELEVQVPMLSPLPAAREVADGCILLGSAQEATALLAKLREA